MYPSGVVAEVIEDLLRTAKLVEDAGLPPSKVILDPGIGFGKTVQQSIDMQRGLSKLVDLGYPVLIGTSRKSSIGKVLGLPMDQRIEGTAATVALAIERGADIVRVHDVKEMVRVAKASLFMPRPQDFQALCEPADGPAQGSTKLSAGTNSAAK